jgi:hypothetical protein
MFKPARWLSLSMLTWCAATSFSQETPFYADFFRQSDLVAIVAFKQEGQATTSGGCPLKYTGTIVTPLRNGAVDEEVSFLSPTVLEVEHPHLVFLQRADPGDYYADGFGQYGSCAFANDDYVIAKLKNVVYGDPAVFEQRHLTAAERGDGSTNDDLYFVGPESAIGLFVDDIRLLGTKARDKSGRTRLVIEGSVEWRILREELGPRVWRSSVAINSDDLLGLLRRVDPQ